MVPFKLAFALPVVTVLWLAGTYPSCSPVYAQTECLPHPREGSEPSRACDALRPEVSVFGLLP